MADRDRWWERVKRIRSCFDANDNNDEVSEESGETKTEIA